MDRKVKPLSSLHLPGSPLFIPSQSVKKKVFHELGLLPQDNKDYIRSNEFSKVGRSQESKEIFPHQEGKAKVEKDAGLGVYDDGDEEEEVDDDNDDSK